MYMKLFVLGLLIGGIVGFVAVGPSCPSVWFSGDMPSNRKNKDFVYAITFANPRTDVETAFAHGDKRFVGFGSPGIETPGIVEAKDVKIINQYSDYIGNFAQLQVNNLIRNYALAYNEYALEKMGIPKTSGTK